MSDTLTGIMVMLVATSVLNIAAVLQKGVVDGLPPLEGQPLRSSLEALLGSRLWVLGLVMVNLAMALNWAALALADMSVIQPLHGFGLIVLALFSRVYLGERLRPPVLVGIGTIIVGLVVMGTSVPEAQTWGDVGELYARYTRPVSLATLIGMLALILGSWAMSGRIARAGILFAFLSAVSSVMALTFAKGLSTAIALEGFDGAAVTWPPYVLLIAALTFATLAISLQQLSFQKGRAVVVTPVFGAASVVLPLGTGALIFGEVVTIQMLVAVMLIAVGVLALGASERPAPQPKNPAFEGLEP